ncbi:MAG: hypothetical protein IJX07_03825 [Bacillales bacterium]|nr:hypothetical protein [Bacillales bacterium]
MIELFEQNNTIDNHLDTAKLMKRVEDVLSLYDIENKADSLYQYSYEKQMILDEGFFVGIENRFNYVAIWFF